jgi:hypothetical protein
MSLVKAAIQIAVVCVLVLDEIAQIGPDMIIEFGVQGSLSFRNRRGNRRGSARSLRYDMPGHAMRMFKTQSWDGIKTCGETLIEFIRT